MSFKVVSWAFHDSPRDLSPAQVLLLVALGDGADDAGHVRFLDDSSQDALAGKTRMSRRSVQRALAVLEDRGLIERSQSSIFDAAEYRVVMRQSDASTQRHHDAASGATMTHRASYTGITGGTRETKLKEHTLPDDWAPNDAHRQLASERGVDVVLEADSFRAHAEANDRKVKRWDAAFRQWLLKARPFQGGPAVAQSARDIWGPGEEWKARG